MWNKSISETEQILNELASRALLVDIEKNGTTVYALPPPMAGFFEFSLMRIRDDIDQKALSELFYQYLNVEEDFVRELFTRGETQSLTTLTLGSKMDEQTIDGIINPRSDKFLLHYTFPPFSTGEARPIRGVSRREIGHG